MRIARILAMSDSMQRNRGSSSQWALASRARSIVVVLSAAACGHASAAGGDDDAGAPGDTSDSPSPLPDGGAGTSATGSLVSVSVQGPGRVTSTPAGIDCGAGSTVCAARFVDGSVTLTTDDGTTVRWSGDCAGNGACAVALGADRTITAQTFAPLRITYDGSDHGQDACYGVAVGPNRTVIATGEVQRFAEGHNVWVRAYDATGGLLWNYEQKTGSEGHDRGNGVVALPDGGAAVAGLWFSGSNSHWNSLVLDLDATGKAAWSALSERIGDDRLFSIARTTTGELYVGGDLVGPGGVMQAWLRGLTAAGAERWSVTRTGTAGAAVAASVAADSAGGVIATGSETNTDTGFDGWMTRYSAVGTPLWSVTLAGPGSDGFGSVAVDRDDNIAVVASLDGASTIRSYTADGVLRWQAGAGGQWSGVAIDGAGNVVASGNADGQLVVAKFTSDGEPVWQRRIAGLTAIEVAAGETGDVVACGYDVPTAKGDAVVVVFPQ
jgi:hypothetical protein